MYIDYIRKRDMLIREKKSKKKIFILSEFLLPLSLSLRGATLKFNFFPSLEFGKKIAQEKKACGEKSRKAFFYRKTFPNVFREKLLQEKLIKSV